VPGRLISPREVEEKTGIAKGTLLQWRHRGIGPPSFKLGGLVRYDETEVDRWIEDSRNHSLKAAAVS
jgi:predicted DNA-binding transcriptional regulator AlpA